MEKEKSVVEYVRPEVFSYSIVLEKGVAASGAMYEYGEQNADNDFWQS